MKQIQNILNTFKEYFESKLPTVLAKYAIPNFDEYIVGPPFEVDKTILATYLANGTHSKDYASESFLVQAQLPKVLDPLTYHTAITEVITSFEAETVWAEQLEYTYGAFYPGDLKDGGGSSFLLYDITLQGELDDCRDDENF